MLSPRPLMRALRRGARKAPGRLMAAVCLCLAAGATCAAPVLLSGAYFDVEYDDTAIGVFGAPTIGGNVVFFTPTTLKAESLNGVGMVTTTADNGFRIIAHSGVLIGMANLSARGDYRMLGASSQVQVGGSIAATTAGSGGAPLVAAITPSTSFTSRDGRSRNWDASALLDFSGAPSGGYSDVDFDLHSILQASTNSVDRGPKLAFVEEKFAGAGFELTVVHTPANQVGEPTPLALGLIAMLAWLGLRREDVVCSLFRKSVD